MSERGTFIVDRGLFGHPVFADEPFTEREAWLWLIAQAAFKPHERRVGRVRVKLARGQLAHATRFMAEAWQWSERSVRRFLAKLTAEHMIAADDAAGVTQITICNYEDYQSATEKPAADTPQTRRKVEETEESKKESEGDARAREPRGSTISPEAHTLADQFLIAVGIDPRNPELSGLAGAPYMAQMWISRGFDPPLILATAADKSARHGPNKPWNWWTKVIEGAHRDRPPVGQRAFPLLQTIEAPREATQRTGPARNWQESRDRFRADHAEFKAGLAAAESAFNRGGDSGGQAA